MARRKTVVADAEGVTMDEESPGVYEVGPRTRTVRTMTEEEVPVEEPATEAPEELNPIDQLLDELGGGTEFDIAVFRVDKSKPNGRVFCGPLAAGGLENSSVLCSRLQEEYGGGSFYLQFRKPGGGKGPFLKRIIVSVDQPKSAQVPAVDQNQIAAAIAAAMAPMQQALAQVAQQKPAFDLSKLAAHPLAATIITALVGKLLGGGGSDKFDLDTYLSMKAKMDAAGFGDGEPNTLAQVGGLLKEYGKPLIELAAKQAATQTGPGPMRPAPSALAPMAAPGVMPAPPAGVAPGTARPVIPAGRASSTTLNVGQMLAPFVPAIVGLAQSGADAHSAAEQIANALPDEYVDPVCDAIESGELVTILTRTPQLSGYSVWLAQVGDALLALMEVEDEPAPANTAMPDEHAGSDGE